MAVEELLKHVPREVIYHRTPLSDDQNALWPWQEAARSLAIPEDSDNLWNLCGESACKCGDACGAGEGSRKETPFLLPADADRELIRRVLDENRAALELQDEGIRRGRLQLPENLAASQWCDVIDHRAEMNIVRLRMLSAKVLAEGRRFAEAAEQLTRMLHTGGVLRSGDCCVVDHLVGLCIEGAASAGIRSFVVLEDVAREVGVFLLAAVDEYLSRPDNVAECLRFDFCNYDLPALDQYPEDADPGALFDIWKPLSDLGMVQNDALVELNAEIKARRPKRRQQFVYLLEGHPHPLDKIATARTIGLKLADVLHGLSEPSRSWPLAPGRLWHRFRRGLRRRRLRRRVAVWPPQVFDPTYGLFGETEEEVHSGLAELDPSAKKRMLPIYLPPTEKQLAAARRRLRRIDNPFGLLLAEGLAEHQAFLRMLARDRTRLENVRSLLQQSLDGRAAGG